VRPDKPKAGEENNAQTSAFCRWARGHIKKMQASKQEPCGYDERVGALSSELDWLSWIATPRREPSSTEPIDCRTLANQGIVGGAERPWAMVHPSSHPTMVLSALEVWKPRRSSRAASCQLSREVPCGKITERSSPRKRRREDGVHIKPSDRSWLVLASPAARLGAGPGSTRRDSICRDRRESKESERFLPGY